MKKKTTKPKLNVRLLRRIQKAILKHPDQFEMAGYFIENLYMPKGTIPAGGCGTAACIAGWAIHITRGNKTVETSSHHRKNYPHPRTEAMNVLGITQDELDRHKLFYSDKWPEPFRGRYHNAKTPLQRSKAAVARIELLIKKGK